MHCWFTAIYLIAESPRISAVELSRQLGLRKNTALSLRRRVQRMMNEDARLCERIIEAGDNSGSVRKRPLQKYKSVGKPL
jgi:hypothetical protein